MFTESVLGMAVGQGSPGESGSRTVPELMAARLGDAAQSSQGAVGQGAP